MSEISPVSDWTGQITAVSPAGITTKAPNVLFADLWAGYPSSKPYIDTKTGKPPKGFENQCAIKVSVALHAAGVDMKSFKSEGSFENNCPSDAFISDCLCDCCSCKRT